MVLFWYFYSLHFHPLQVLYQAFTLPGILFRSLAGSLRCAAITGCSSLLLLALFVRGLTLLLWIELVAFLSSSWRFQYHPLKVFRWHCCLLFESYKYSSSFFCVLGRSFCIKILSNYFSEFYTLPGSLIYLILRLGIWTIRCRISVSLFFICNFRCIFIRLSTCQKVRFSYRLSFSPHCCFRPLLPIPKNQGKNSFSCASPHSGFSLSRSACLRLPYLSVHADLPSDFSKNFVTEVTCFGFQATHQPVSEVPGCCLNFFCRS